MKSTNLLQSATGNCSVASAPFRLEALESSILQPHRVGLMLNNNGVRLNKPKVEIKGTACANEQKNLRISPII